MRIFVALRHVILGVEVYQHLKLFSLNISIFIQHFFWFWFFFLKISVQGVFSGYSEKLF
jgi:hypothetical protein